MTSFIDLQNHFLKAQFRVFGLPPDDGCTLQPAAVQGDGDEQLWSWFNAIPAAGALYAPSESEFFNAYQAVIGSLIASTGSPFDPVTVAKKKLLAWGAKPPAWSAGDAAMRALLAGAPAIHFTAGSEPAPATGFWGLWMDSEPVSGIPERFAAGGVSMSLSFAHLLNFAPRPGDWFLSSALSMAYSNPDKHPWDPGSPINWQTTFGGGGTLNRFLRTLIIAEAPQVHYTSAAPFDAAEQHHIKAGAATGLWPYYLNGAAARTAAAFDSAGRLTAEISGTPGQPVILAAATVSAGTYLGLG